MNRFIARMSCLCCVAAFLVQQPVRAQQVAVAASKMNVAYIGIDNPLTIAVSNYDCKDLVVSTNNGSISKESSCSYIFHPKEPGSAKIIIEVKKGIKTILLDSVNFRSKHIPDPVTQVGGKSGGNIKRGIFRVQEGVVATLMNFDFDAHYIISSFSLSISRRGQLRFTGQSTGPRFEGNIAIEVQTVEVDDMVTIEDIRIKGPDGQVRILTPITFHIMAD